MNFAEYQRESRETALYPVLGHAIVYPTLGLVGEAGEVAEKVKKLMRDKGGVLDEEARQALQKELGDVLWCASQVAYEAGLDLETIAAANLEKLRSRKARGVIQGSGDNR